MNTQKHQRDAKRIGKAIAARRVAAELTQSQVAELLGFTQETVSRMERGLFDIPATRMIDLADIFECEVAEFFHRLPTPPKAIIKDVSNMFVGLAQHDMEHCREMLARETSHLRGRNRAKREPKG